MRSVIIVPQAILWNGVKATSSFTFHSLSHSLVIHALTASSSIGNCKHLSSGQHILLRTHYRITLTQDLLACSVCILFEPSSTAPPMLSRENRKWGSQNSKPCPYGTPTPQMEDYPSTPLTWPPTVDSKTSRQLSQQLGFLDGEQGDWPKGRNIHLYSGKS